MKPQAAFVGSDGRVELDPEAPVNVDVSLLVLPRYPELDNSFRLHQAVHDALFNKLRAGLHHRDQGGKDLADGLMELRLCRVPGHDAVHQTVQILIFDAHFG